jgi:hypothetical protein
MLQVPPSGFRSPASVSAGEKEKQPVGPWERARSGRHGSPAIFESQDFPHSSRQLHASQERSEGGRRSEARNLFRSLFLVVLPFLRLGISCFDTHMVFIISGMILFPRRQDSRFVSH